MKLIVKNKKATYDYELLEKYEAGIVLSGTEVKAIRDNRINFLDSYVQINKNNEAYIYKMHIGHYDKGNIFNHDELRKRKLLLNKKEIQKISFKTVEQGISVIPVRMYFKHNLIKIEIAVARGKKKYDKRQSLKEKDDKRNVEKMLKYKNR